MKFAAAFTLFVASVSAQSNPSVRRRLQATYAPGDFSDETNVIEDTERGTKMYLSKGLGAKAIAYSGEPVVLSDGSELDATYHGSADGGACIPKEGGGYYYVSNAEQGQYPADFDLAADAAEDNYREAFAANLTGGAYSLEFDADYNFVGYSQILSGTAGNCAGGATPWGSWVSCEERREFGTCWQSDPSGSIPARPTATTPIGIPGYGNWEALAWDGEHAYVTDDDYQKAADEPAYRGALVKYTPDKAAKACLEAEDNEDKWCALESGSLSYLKLSTCEEGKFDWVTDLESSNPLMYAGAEGVAVADGILTFVTIKDKMIFELNLAERTYTKKAVPFPQEPDNIVKFGDTLYVCTDGDHEPDDAIWGVDETGAYKVFYEEGHNYPAGVAFSPDGMRMYASMWGEATWEFWRTDGLAFDAEHAGAVYEVLAADMEAGTQIEKDGDF